MLQNEIDYFFVTFRKMGACCAVTTKCEEILQNQASNFGNLPTFLTTFLCLEMSPMFYGAFHGFLR